MCGLLLFAATTIAVQASDAAVKPIGFFFNSIADSEDNPFESHARFVRDGIEYDAVEGSQVYPGDTILTGDNGGIAIAFLDSSSIRLHGSSELTVQSLGNPAANEATTVTLVKGHASAATRSFGGPGPSETSLLQVFLGLGGTSGSARAGGGSGTTKFDVITTRDPNGTTFTSTVAVISGSATLTPKTGTKVDIGTAAQVVMTVNTAVPQATPPQTVINKGNLTKDQIKALVAGAVAVVVVTVNKTGIATLKTATVNPDGSITAGSISELSTGLTKDVWATKLGKTTIATWTETLTTIGLKRNYNGFVLSGKIVKATESGSATLKGPDKVTYKGSMKYDPATGKYTFTGTAKDGSTATFTYSPNGANGYTQTVTVTKGGTTTTSTSTFDFRTGLLTQTGKPDIQFKPNPAGSTTVNTGIAQDSPPVSQ
jgi:hypothetical protein